MVKLDSLKCLVCAGPLKVEVDTMLAGDTPTEDEHNHALILEHTGANKIQVIAVIRGLTGLGLRDAKDLADKVPSVVLRTMDRDAILSGKLKLEEVGATARALTT